MGGWDQSLGSFPAIPAEAEAAGDPVAARLRQTVRGCRQGGGGGGRVVRSARRHLSRALARTHTHRHRNSDLSVQGLVQMLCERFAFGGLMGKTMKRYGHEKLKTVGIFHGPALLVYRAVQSLRLRQQRRDETYAAKQAQLATPTS